MDKLLVKISAWYNGRKLKRGVISEEDYSDFDFVFRTNLYNILIFVIFLLIGALIGKFAEMVALFLVFNVLRDKSGGIHSYGNLNFCLLFSTFLFIGMCFLCALNLPYKIMAFIAIIFAFIKAPYINQGYEEKKIEDVINKFDFLLLAILFWALSFLPFEANISNAINIAIIFVALFMSKTMEKIFFGIRGVIDLISEVFKKN